MRQLIKWVGALCLCGVTVQALAAADGANLYQSKVCASCHGADGKTPIMPMYPKIVGQHKDYILQQMQDIKSGRRNNGQSISMQGIMTLVSDQEMDVIATWLSTITADVKTPSLTTKAALLYKEKTCIACHGADGNSPVMTVYPKLVGQKEAYLVNQMKDIKAGVRTNSHSQAMKNVMHLVSDKDMSAIAKWLSGNK